MVFGHETVTDYLVSVSFLACFLLVICDMNKVPLRTFTADEIAAAPSTEPALEGPSHSGLMKWSSLHFRVVDMTGREMFASPDSTVGKLKRGVRSGREDWWCLPREGIRRDPQGVVPLTNLRSKQKVDAVAHAHGERFTFLVTDCGSVAIQS